MKRRTQPAVTEQTIVTRTMSGHYVSLSPERWAYRDALSTVSLSFEVLRDNLAEELLETYRQVLLYYVENTSPEYLQAVHDAFSDLVSRTQGRKRPVKAITAAHVLNFNGTAGRTTMAKAAALIKRWQRMGHPGVQDAAAALKLLKIGADPKGVAVLTMDPKMGPYSDVEWGAIQSALDEAFVDRNIDEDIYFMSWLFLALGSRPTQLAAMKVCDVLEQEDAQGVRRYFAMVPRAKQGLARPRMEFKVRPLIKEIGKPLFDYGQAVKARFTGVLTHPDKAPLFPAAVTRAEQPQGFEHHRTAASLTQALKRCLSSLDIQSERTGRRLHVTAIRFRRTVGTRAAQEGHGELVIAELLDHSDTQNVSVYVAAVPEIAERIDKAVAMELAPLARAFKGRITDEKSSVPGAAKEIIDLRIDRSGVPMGGCDQSAGCNYLAPIACYTCRSFNAWSDGPHEAVLAFLLDRRDRLLSVDKRMASIHDRTILAVAEVIDACVKSGN